MSSLGRTATSDAYAASLTRLATRQQTLTQMQENLTAGKRVLRASDDPASAAQAERARTRMSRVESDQRALEVQRNALTTAESSLNSATTLMQRFRELIVQGGNTLLSATDRASIVLEMQGLRDQILTLANTKDSNGQPLFGGLGSADAPFVDQAGGVVYNGLPGQAASTGVSLPATLDGFATFMDVPTGNGVFTVAQSTTTSGVWSDQGQVTNPALLTGHNYSIQFTVTGATTTYSVVDTTSATTVQSNQPYTAGQTISFDGMSIVTKGTPANGESLNIAPAGRDSLFGTIDRAIAAVQGNNGAGNVGGNSGKVSQDIARALTEIDTGMARLAAARGQAGMLMARADSITDQQSTRSIQLEADRSREEDLDMVKALSDFDMQKTAYSVALQTYAQIQKLSLFNFIS